MRELRKMDMEFSLMPMGLFMKVLSEMINMTAGEEQIIIQVNLETVITMAMEFIRQILSTIKDFSQEDSSMEKESTSQEKE